MEKDGLVAFPGSTFWVRPTDYVSQHERSGHVRAADLECCYTKLAAGVYHTGVRTESKMFGLWLRALRANFR